MYAVIFFFGRRTSRSLEIAEDDRKRLDAKIRRQAYYDSLTGLPNRAMFLERIHAQQDSKALNVLYVDLDRFKLVNDSLGQKAGDQILSVTAKRLHKLLSTGDQLFRVGGDEFVFLQRSDDPMLAHLLALKVVREIAELQEIDGTTVSVTASVGVARWPADDSVLESTVRCADIAMYVAKRSGLNQLAVFREAMREEMQAKVTLMSDLKQAVNNNEFVLHYQPRLNSKTRSIESVEALIRWNHPRHGLLYPEKFIIALENSPLIVDVGRWALQAACNQAMSWRANGSQPIKISVNIAPKQFRNKNFVDSVVAALQSSGLPPTDLELELTEGQLIDDLDSAIGILTQIKALGVSVAIDDFGTGYSSLCYLHRLPIDCLKIDRSFVSNIANGCEAGKIAQTITTLAHSLGLVVVAEGVETLFQADTLTQWGCEQLQGYVFSEPVPAELIPELLTKSTIKTKPTVERKLAEELLVLV
jgi:diguanylate cyclase (GGDEF)-like protein